MRFRDGRFLRSPTDLANFLRCDHLLQLERWLAVEVAEGRAEPRDVSGELAVKKGNEFEKAWVAQQRAQVEARGGTFVHIEEQAGPNRQDQHRLLAESMAAGVDAIAQAPLSAHHLGGYADLLELVQRNGTPSYEPVEVKLAKNIRSAHVLQLCAYLDALERQTATQPAGGWIVSGDRMRHRVNFHEVMAYYRDVRDRFDEAMKQDLDEALARVPERVAHCGRCVWADRCNAQRDAVGHLSVVANIRTSQIRALRNVGIDSIGELATSTIDRVPGIGKSTLPTVREQARLQHAARTDGEHRWEFRPPDQPGRGFARLPEPDAGDVFFDFEGYPYAEGGLEYLWGWVTLDERREPQFQYLWADTPADERVALERFLQYVHERRAEHPGMHVYHYAAYEVTALLRLVRRHHDLQESLDQLLREEVFVDLYAVVRQSMLVSQPSYSIKYLEPIYGVSRADDEVTSAGASIEEYERWLETEDPAVRQGIIDYNRVDCESTVGLRDWMLERRDEAASRGIVWQKLAAAPDAGEDGGQEDPEAGDAADPHARDELCRRLGQICESHEREDVALAASLFRHLLGWVGRTRRQFWGELHGRKDAPVEEYVDDPEALGGLEFIESYKPARARGDTLVHRFAFPQQETIVEPKDDAIDPVHVVERGTIVAIDPDAGVVEVKQTAATLKKLQAQGDPPWSGALIGHVEYPDYMLVNTVQVLADGFADTVESEDHPFGGQQLAAWNLLARRLPVVAGLEHGADLLATDVDADVTVISDLVRRLDGSALVVQGPPGTGKTWTIARVVADLASRGLTVGLMSNSHAAICNMLDALDKHLEEPGVSSDVRAAVRCAYKKASNAVPPTADWLGHDETKANAARLLSGEVTVVAGTAWQFARPELDRQIDVVIIDEAGQVSLLHAAAAASAARRLFLVGDPQQLPQPTGVGHPEGSGASILQHLFAGDETIPPNRGVLLPVTRRMQPQVAQFISDAFYEGRVRWHELTEQQRVDCGSDSSLCGAGLRMALIDHEGCSTASEAEALAVRSIVERLTTSTTWTNQDGEVQPLTLKDILIVAPYNRQVRLVKSLLPDGARVGTIDKFQGQEGAVSIWSVTASSRDDIPRGMDFLLSPNRMNVAISRARALSVVVASPRLLATRCGTIEEMRLVNRLALYRERAQVVDV